MSDFVVPLGTADAVPATLGGLGDRLNRLALDRLPVQPGLVLNTGAYFTFIHFNNLEGELGAVQQLDAAAPTDLVSAAVRIRRRFLDGPLPSNLARRLDELWTNLDGRSLQLQASWAPEPQSAPTAGVNTHYAAIKDREAFLEAVRACWASAWTAPLLRHHRAEPVGVAVIVQEALQPSASGTLSTELRAANQAKELIITASPDDAQLQGRPGTRERYVIDKSRGDVKRVQVGPAPLLAPDQLTELALGGLAAEQALAQPVSLTWVLAKGQFIFARVDALPTEDDATTRADWSRQAVGAHWPEPLTPLTWSLWAPLLTQAGRDVAARWRLFPRGEEPERWLKRVDGHLVWQQGRLVEAFISAYGLPADLVASPDGRRTGSRWRYRSLLRRLPRLLRLWRRPAASPTDPGVDWTKMAVVEPRAGNGLWLGTESGDLAALQAHLTRYVGLTAAAAVVDLLLSALGDREMGQAAVRPGESTSSAGAAPLTELPVALQRLAQTLKDPALTSIQRQADSVAALEQLDLHPAAAPFRQALAHFLAQYGYLCLNAAELRHPRWLERPDRLLSLLTGPATVEGEPPSTTGPDGLDSASSHQDDSPASRPRRAGLAILRRQQRRWLVQQAASYTALLGQLTPLRQRAMMLAERWVERGWLDRTDDLFFLALAEIETVLRLGSPTAAGISLTELIVRRRAAYQRWQANEARAVAEPAKRLQGTPLSPGRARGRVRVVTEPGGAPTIRAGEILVTAAAEAGWTALFSLIGGLVIEMSDRHGPGSAVGRAVGLPIVADVPQATRRLVTGQWIEIDGHSGQLVVEDKTDDARH